MICPVVTTLLGKFFLSLWKAHAVITPPAHMSSCNSSSMCIILYFREIMNLANKMIYNDRLQCGNEEVAMGTLKLIPMEHDRVPQWMAMALDPHLPVLFLDTDQCSDAREVNTGGQVGNMFEAKLAASLILNLLKV